MSRSLDGYLILRTFDDLVSTFENIRDGLAIVGAIYTTSAILRIIQSMMYATRVYVIPRLFYPNDLSSRYGGKWAVVTGATEGIGQSYARKLAQRKMNILLICKNKDKLHKFAEEINLDYKVETKCISIDLVNLTDDNYSYIENMLNEIDIGILVNNAETNNINFSTSLGRKLNQYLIDHNIKATVLMSNMVLPQMIKRKAGAIVTISSLISSLPLPYMVLQSASKVFIDSFSKLLQTENAAHNIFIQTVQPGLVNTLPLQSSMLDRFFIVDPDTYCESAVRTLGLSHKTHGYWKHGIVSYLNKFFQFFYLL